MTASYTLGQQRFTGGGNSVSTRGRQQRFYTRQTTAFLYADNTSSTNTLFSEAPPPSASGTDLDGTRGTHMLALERAAHAAQASCAGARSPIEGGAHDLDGTRGTRIYALERAAPSTGIHALSAQHRAEAAHTAQAST